MPVHSQPGSIALVFLFLGTCLPVPLQAQDRPSLSVRFEYRHLKFGNHFASDAERMDSERILTDQICTTLSEKIDIWQFVRGDATVFPRLEVFMARDGDTWEVHLALIADSSNQAVGEWKTPFLEAGDAEALSALPHRSEWPARIGQKLRNRILDGTMEGGRNSEVFAALRKWVPLVKEVVPLGDLPPQSAEDARSALPLDWEKNCSIARSTFSISFEWGDRGEVTLHSVGTSKPALYDATKPSGITVLHRMWIHAGRDDEVRNHLNQLGELKPISVRLEKFERFPRPCTTVAATDLSVAPTR